MEKPAVKQHPLTAGRRTGQHRTGKRGLCAALAALAVWLLPVEALALQTPAREAKTVTATEKIPYGVRYIDLPDMYRGYTEKVSDGAYGEREIQMQVLTEGGRTLRVLAAKSVDTGRPVDQVVRRGSKVLRSETYDGSPWRTSFANPLGERGWLSADFYDYPGHNGIDIAAPYGTTVRAAAEGKVAVAGWSGGYGRCVLIRHADGSETLYGHNSQLLVSPGQWVKQGEPIAKVGSTGNSTGNHVHFELRVDGQFLDPLIYLDQ